MSGIWLLVLFASENTTAGEMGLGQYIEALADRNGLRAWDWVAIILSLCSLGVAFFMAVWQKRTERNTMKITEEGQIGLLVDYIRHFYTNLVIAVSVTERFGGRYATHYPSQEHFRKLSVDLEALHPEAFFHSKEKYELVHKLLLLVRNYNIEAGVAEEHLCSRFVSSAAKERALSTLIFKPEHFCERFIDCIKKLSAQDTRINRLCRKSTIFRWVSNLLSLRSLSTPPKKTDKEYLMQVRQSIIHEAFTRTDKLKEVKDEARKLEIIRSEAKSIRRYYSSPQSSFVSEIFADDPDLFYDLINHNIHTEITTNNILGYPKIFIIPFGEDE